ncbi:cysteine hydrolase family protein [Paraburkholderia sp. EG286B]|uniref:cysteine hydrolase family protein n=1 Tax=Paraburkholderia sp. EG286B TaxID=3237011 RepID=UPI0034D331D7
MSSLARALLVIDMQEGLFNGPNAPFEGQRVLANIRQLIAEARKARAPVFAARHVGPPGSPIEPGSPLTQLLPALAIDPDIDGVFEKRRPSCFTGTDLAARLACANVGELVIAGMQTEYCVDSTCRTAGDLGFRALLVADAHTTMDTPVLRAASIIEHHNRTLSGPFVRLASTADCAFDRAAE